jgi:hypothetical protein
MVFAKRYENFFYDRIQAENTEEFHCYNVSACFLN